jgi:hypothetical protein
MFKIGESPSVRAGPVEHADYLELECLRKRDRFASGADLTTVLGRLSDDSSVSERTDAADRLEGTVDAAFYELELRAEHSRGIGLHRYPFVVEPPRLLRFVGGHNSSLYLFLLLATRTNMKADREQNGIDGTLLFEAISCQVAKQFFGERADGHLFGTSRRLGADPVGNFPAAVNQLCLKIGEGGGFHPHSGHPPTAQDGGLDVVVWKRFVDQRTGQLIGFGQCKTGTHWESELRALVPSAFLRKWVREPFTVEPLRMFFITDRVHSNGWYDACIDAGILFDRCRILDYAPSMRTLKKQWTSWVHAARIFHGLS